MIGIFQGLRRSYCPIFSIKHKFAQNSHPSTGTSNNNIAVCDTNINQTIDRRILPVIYIIPLVATGKPDRLCFVDFIMDTEIITGVFVFHHN